MFSLVKFIKLLDIFNYTNSLSQLIFSSFRKQHDNISYKYIKSFT